MTILAAAWSSTVPSLLALVGGLKGSQDLPLVNEDDDNLALSVDTYNMSTLYSGVLSGGGSLTKLGTGTLTLTELTRYLPARRR